MKNYLTLSVTSIYGSALVLTHVKKKQRLKDISRSPSPTANYLDSTFPHKVTPVMLSPCYEDAAKWSFKHEHSGFTFVIVFRKYHSFQGRTEGKYCLNWAAGQNQLGRRCFKREFDHPCNCVYRNNAGWCIHTNAITQWNLFLSDANSNLISTHLIQLSGIVFSTYRAIFFFYNSRLCTLFSFKPHTLEAASPETET